MVSAHQDEPHGWEALSATRPHRVAAPLHYVIGRMSPFYIERFISRDRQRMLFAVYYGAYTTNGAHELGVGQGGAQAALFDCLCATCAVVAQEEPRRRVATADLAVQMRRPVGPIPGVFRMEAWLHSREGRKHTVRATITLGGPEDPVLASAEAMHLELRGPPSPSTAGGGGVTAPPHQSPRSKL